MTTRVAEAQTPREAAPAQLVARGAWHVRLGIGITLAAVVAIGVNTAMLVGEFRSTPVMLRYAGGFVWQAIVSAGLLAGSRVARVIAIVTGAFWVLGAVTLGTLALRLGNAGTYGGRSLIAFAVGLAVMAAGTALATLTPAGHAYHAARHMAQAARRKAKSLAEWRQP